MLCCISSNSKIQAMHWNEHLLPKLHTHIQQKVTFHALCTFGSKFSSSPFCTLHNICWVSSSYNPKFRLCIGTHIFSQNYIIKKRGKRTPDLPIFTLYWRETSLINMLFYWTFSCVNICACHCFPDIIILIVNFNFAGFFRVHWVLTS